MKYPHKCCRCGFCCLSELCPVIIMLNNENPKLFDLSNGCPALSFHNKIAVCMFADAGLLPVGQGCCISARCFQDGVQYDFASLQPEIKIKVAQNTLKKGKEKMPMNPHRGQCCVCGHIYREGIEPVSHGYCKPCETKIINEIKGKDKENGEMDSTDRDIRV